ncbi:MAG: dTMP kinase [Salinispira sp.]
MFANSKILKNFIILEGLDGSGTTTQQTILKNFLQEKDIPYHLTSEPTTFSIGRLIRNILSTREHAEKSTLAYLFAADRNEHLHASGGMIEMCNQNRLVICDRYLFSSLAYQGCDLGMEYVWELNKNFPLPEILFYIDIDPLQAENRYASRAELEIYEKKETQKQVRANYNVILTELEKTPVQLYRIDATLPIEKISAEIWTKLSNLPIVKG